VNTQKRLDKRVLYCLSGVVSACEDSYGKLRRAPLVSPDKLVEDIPVPRDTCPDQALNVVAA
jgi:hypothetical protein